jgi:hypothetical protein
MGGNNFLICPLSFRYVNSFIKNSLAKTIYPLSGVPHKLCPWSMNNLSILSEDINGLWL